ncbi:MAG: hypothetical protein IIA66_14790 [Planctomycetes bacterium]|nr:hypothetical protein [Planctomycetota bacterium]
MNTTYGIAAMLAVWALPVQAERIEDRPAVQNRDAVPLMMSVRLSEADRPVTSGESLHRSVRKQARRIMPRLGPAPKVHLTGEQIAEAVRGAEAGASGEVLIVDCHGNYDHDTIQTAIDAASDGDVIIVLPNTCTEDGHYFENINFLGKAIAVQSLLPEDPGTVAATIIDGSWATGDEIEGSVVTINQGEGASSILDGLTLMNGKGFKPSPHASNGGGVYCHMSSPTLRNLVIRENTADTYGGGMYVYYGSPVLANCRFENNTGNSGGALTFVGNSEPGPVLSHCKFSGNNATAGGAIHNTTTRPLFLNCSFIQNEASTGGAIRVQSGRPTLVGCLLAENTSLGSGGAIVAIAHADTTLVGCTVSNNSAGHGGGAIYTGICCDTVLANCLLWGNSAPLGPQIRMNGFSCNSSLNISYSNIEGGLDDIVIGANDVVIWGPGNIDFDPLFVNPFDDYHLSSGSPCIDAADNTAVREGILTDLDGNPRFVDDPDTPDTGNPDGVNPPIDMGAYEFGSSDSCADDDGDGRVTICHMPPGNPENAHTIRVGVTAAPAHLAHGDHCGPCE